MTDLEAVKFWGLAKKGGVTRVKVGDSVVLKQGDPSHFGSGGVTATWLTFGELSQEVVDATNNGFTITREVQVTFDGGPAAVFTTAGDSLNGGRVFYRQLVVAE